MLHFQYPSSGSRSIAPVSEFDSLCRGFGFSIRAGFCLQCTDSLLTAKGEVNDTKESPDNDCSCLGVYLVSQSQHGRELYREVNGGYETGECLGRTVECSAQKIYGGCSLF